MTAWIFTSGLLLGIVIWAIVLRQIRRRREDLVHQQAAICITHIENAARHFIDSSAAATEEVRQRQRMVKTEFLSQLQQWAHLFPDESSLAIASIAKDMAQTNGQLTANLIEAKKELAGCSSEIESFMSAAHTDTLTGLPNRRAFDEQLTRRFAEWEHTGLPFTLLLFDIDNFKQFNDLYGHLVGDAVLASISTALGSVVRSRDLLARFGGEEFIIIMPATNARGGCAVARRVMRAMAQNEHYHNGRRLRVTISCGVTEVRSGDDASKLIDRSDSALYASKEAGRNCGHIHDGTKHLLIPGDDSSEQSDEAFIESLAKVPGGATPELAQLCQDLQARLQELTREKEALGV